MRQFHLLRLPLPALGWPNNRAVAEKHPVSAYLTCWINATLPREFANPYLADVQLLRILFGCVHIHDSSQKRGHDALIETPATVLRHRSLGGGRRLKRYRIPFPHPPRIQHIPIIVEPRMLMAASPTYLAGKP